MSLLSDNGFINDSAEPTSDTINGKTVQRLWYAAWTSIAHRAYSRVSHVRNPTYVGCTVCPEWKSAEAFRRWHIEHYVEGYHLDKDILSGGNKIYSPSTCMYVPQQINKLFNNHSAARGNLPQGVYWNVQAGKFKAALKVDGKLKYLGLFDDARLAFIAYLTEKLPHMRSVLDSVPSVGSRVSDELLRAHMNVVAAEGLSLLDTYKETSSCE